eukprot:3713449-Pleurochrysis_carterae.AAC.1
MASVPCMSALVIGRARMDVLSSKSMARANQLVEEDHRYVQVFAQHHGPFTPLVFSERSDGGTRLLCCAGEVGAADFAVFDTAAQGGASRVEMQHLHGWAVEREVVAHLISDDDVALGCHQVELLLARLPARELRHDEEVRGVVWVLPNSDRLIRVGFGIENVAQEVAERLHLRAAEPEPVPNVNGEASHPSVLADLGHRLLDNVLVVRDELGRLP